MLRDIELPKLGDLISMGFISDMAVLEISNKLANNNIDDGEKRAIETAIKFLRRIIEGQQTFEKKSIDAEAIKSFTAYNRAIQAFSLKPESFEITEQSPDFIEIISRFIDILSNTLEDSEVKRQDLIMVRMFFFLLSETMLQESSSILEGKGRTQPWPPSTSRQVFFVQ